MDRRFLYKNIFNKMTGNLEKYYLVIFIILIFCGSSPAVDFQITNPDTTTFYGAFQGFGAQWNPFFWDTKNQSNGCNQAG